jgi:ATP-binding cassette subfamily B protein
MVTTAEKSPDSFQNLENKHPARWVLDILLERRILFSGIVIGIIIHQSMRFVIPVVIGDLVEFGIEAGDKSQVEYYSWLLISIALISAFFDLTMSWLNEIAANDVEYKTRDIYFKSVQNKNMAFHDEARLGELLSIAQNDLRSLYTAVAPGLRLFGESMISIVVVTVLIFFESTLLGIVFVFLLPIWFYFLRRYNNSMTPAAVDQQQKFRDLSANVNENLVAAKVVRAFSQEEHEIDQFNQHNAKYTHSWNHRGKVTALFYPMLLTYSLSGVMFFLGIYLVQNPVIEFGVYTYHSDFDIPALITVMGIIILFRQPTFFVGATLELASLGFAGVEKVQNIIVQGTSEEKELNLENKYVVTNGSINFENVDFEYNSTPILKEITFKVKAGEVVAIVGPPGSGKTTLLKLLTRFYEPTEGKISIDDRQITEYDLITLRKSVGVVEQDVHLFSDTIARIITNGTTESANNVRYQST